MIFVNIFSVQKSFLFWFEFHWNFFLEVQMALSYHLVQIGVEQAATQIAKLMGPTWGPPGCCQPQMGPMLASWTLLSGKPLDEPTMTQSTNELMHHQSSWSWCSASVPSWFDGWFSCGGPLPCYWTSVQRSFLTSDFSVQRVSILIVCYFRCCEIHHVYSEFILENKLIFSFIDIENAQAV